MSSHPEQYMSALDRANEIRLARAELKQRIARGEVFAASVLLDPPAEARTWAIYDLLISQRLWGRTRTLNTLKRMHVSESRPLGGLTDRERRVLARVLGGEGES